MSKTKHHTGEGRSCFKIRNGETDVTAARNNEGKSLRWISKKFLRGCESWEPISAQSRDFNPSIIDIWDKIYLHLLIIPLIQKLWWQGHPPWPLTSWKVFSSHQWRDGKSRSPSVTEDRLSRLLLMSTLVICALQKW